MQIKLKYKIIYSYISECSTEGELPGTHYQYIVCVCCSVDISLFCCFLDTFARFSVVL